MRKIRFGFTLAEVLITLAIIGVVAAMTIPTLINKYQDRVLETQYRKGISVLANGINLMMAREEVIGDISKTTLHDCYANNDATCFNNLIKEYFLVNTNSENTSFGIMDDVEYSTYNSAPANQSLWMPAANAAFCGNVLDDYYVELTCEYYYNKEITGSNGYKYVCPEGMSINSSAAEITPGGLYTNCWNNAASERAVSAFVAACCVAGTAPDSTNNTNYWQNVTYGFQTGDGIALGFMPAEVNEDGTILTYAVLMDVNGAKKPNKVNKDLFTLTISPQGKVISPR